MILNYKKFTEMQLKNESLSPKETASDITGEQLVNKIIKSNPNFKWLKDELGKKCTVEEVKKVLDSAGYANEFDKHIKSE
jgi:uncharacterized protein YPO0396